MPKAGKSGWELIYEKTHKTREFFEYNTLRSNEDTQELMRIYKKLYPIARDRLYKLSKSDIAETRHFQKWVLSVKPSPTHLSGDDELYNALYDVAHLLASDKFSVSGYHAYENRQQRNFEEKFGLHFEDRVEYREFVRFLDKFSSVVNGGLRYTVSYAYNVYEDVRNTLKQDKLKIKVSYIMDRFIDFKESAAERRARKFSVRMYDFKDLIKDYIKDNKEALSSEWAIHSDAEKSANKIPTSRGSRETYQDIYKVRKPKRKNGQ